MTLVQKFQLLGMCWTIVNANEDDEYFVYVGQRPRRWATRLQPGTIIRRPWSKNPRITWGVDALNGFMEVNGKLRADSFEELCEMYWAMNK